MKLSNISTSWESPKKNSHNKRNHHFIVSFIFSISKITLFFANCEIKHPANRFSFIAIFNIQLLSLSSFIWISSVSRSSKDFNAGNKRTMWNGIFNQRVDFVSDKAWNYLDFILCNVVELITWKFFNDAFRRWTCFSSILMGFLSNFLNDIILMSKTSYLI